MKLSNSSINKFINPWIFQYWFCLVLLLCFVVFGQYPLNDNFVVKEELVKQWSGSDWIDYWKTNYTYDSKWNLEECKIQEWESGWVNVQKDIYIIIIMKIY